MNGGVIINDAGKHDVNSFTYKPAWVHEKRFSCTPAIAAAAGVAAARPA
jgi:hypothetical protein